MRATAWPSPARDTTPRGYDSRRGPETLHRLSCQGACVGCVSGPRSVIPHCPFHFCEYLARPSVSFRQASLTSLLESVTSALQGIIRRWDLDAGGGRRVSTPQTAQTPPSSQAQPRRGLGAT